MEALVFSLFCEDIRDEKVFFSAMGVLPDNLGFLSFPSTMQKLGVYTKITFDVGQKVDTMSSELRWRNGESIGKSLIEAGEIEEARRQALDTGVDTVTFALKTIVQSLSIARPDEIQSIVTVNGRVYIAGTLRIMAAPDQSPV